MQRDACRKWTEELIFSLRWSLWFLARVAGEWDSSDKCLCGVSVINASKRTWQGERSERLCPLLCLFSSPSMVTLTYISITHTRQTLSASCWGDLMHMPDQKHPKRYAVDWGLHFGCCNPVLFLRRSNHLMKDSEEKRVHGSPSRKFVIVSGKMNWSCSLFS